MNDSVQGARWNYKGISLELQAYLVHGQTRYAIPTYAGEGWGHVFLKVTIAAHLLQWGYKWDDIHWEYDPPDVAGQRRADIFVKGRNALPSFWFECRTTDDDKMRELRPALPPEVRVVHVMPSHWFLRWWNGDNLRLSPSLNSKEKRIAIRKYRAEISVVGVEYWAVYDTSESARILFAVRREGNDRYTYFDTGEGWSLSHISMLSRRTDCWTPLITGIVGDNRESGYDTYLPRKTK